MSQANMSKLSTLHPALRVWRNCQGRLAANGVSLKKESCCTAKPRNVALMSR